MRPSGSFVRSWLWLLSTAAIVGAACGAEKAAPTPRKLEALLKDLRSKEAARVQGAEQVLSKLPLARQADLSRALLRERNLQAASVLVRLLSRRGHAFKQMNELPRVLGVEIHKRCGALAQARTPAELKRAYQRLLELGDAAAPWLVPVLADLRQTARVRRRAAIALARMGRLEGFPVLLDALADEQGAYEALKELLALKQRGVKALLRFGLTHPNERVRRRVAEILGWLGAGMGGRELAEALLQHTHDRSKEVALATRIALANLHEERLFDPLLKDLDKAKADRFRAHATSVALAASMRSDDLPEVLQLARSRSAARREAAALILGVGKVPGGADGAGKPVVETLRRLLGDSASRVQKRAAEALGSLIERGNRQAQAAQEALGHSLRTGRMEVRYAAALALGELAARGVPLPTKLRRSCEAVLRTKKIEEAAGACHEALLSVTEPLGAQPNGSPAGSYAAAPSAPSATPDAPSGERVTGKPGGGAASPSPSPSDGKERGGREGSGKTNPLPENYYREGFRWKEGGKGKSKAKVPITEAKLPEGKTEPGKTGPSGSETALPNNQANPSARKGKGKGKGKDKDKAGPAEMSPAGDGDEAAGGGVYARRRRSKIPAGLPLYRRYRLEAIENPAHPGKPALSGYVRVN